MTRPLKVWVCPYCAIILDVITKYEGSGFNSPRLCLGLLGASIIQSHSEEDGLGKCEVLKRLPSHRMEESGLEQTLGLPPTVVHRIQGLRTE